MAEGSTIWIPCAARDKAEWVRRDYVAAILASCTDDRPAFPEWGFVQHCFIFELYITIVARTGVFQGNKFNEMELLCSRQGKYDMARRFLSVDNRVF